MTRLVNQTVRLYVPVHLRLGTFMPDGLHTVAEVVDDMAVLGAVACVDAMAGRQEAADDTGDVTADVELLRIVYADTLYAEAETADAW